MRLLSQISRRYKNNSYRKYWIIVPKKILGNLGWKTGQELKVDVENNKLIIEKNEKAKE